MPKNYLKLFFIFMLGVGLTGCGTAGSGIQIRSYVEDKPRVNTEITGNQGYLLGTPPAADISNKKKTRKMYVLEISKAADLEEGRSGVNENTAGGMAGTDMASDDSSSREISQVSKEQSEVPSFVEYKVEKDDTLQKISKKFYDTYKKWPKIYEANKEKIKDPNHIKPGITLKIPRE